MEKLWERDSLGHREVWTWRKILKQITEKHEIPWTGEGQSKISFVNTVMHLRVI